MLTWSVRTLVEERSWEGRGGETDRGNCEKYRLLGRRILTGVESSREIHPWGVEGRCGRDECGLGG